MGNHASRTAVADAKRRALAAGYRIREGAYVGTTDDVAGTWYVVGPDDDLIDARGRGYARRGHAWLAAAEVAEQDATNLHNAHADGYL
jgi:hypothetical protein